MSLTSFFQSSNCLYGSIIIRASQRLGYTVVRPMQLQAIRSFMEGNDVLICLPTGSGKSLCYSVLPYAFDDLLNPEGSIVVVVSPLIALMKDQVSNMIIHIEFVHQLLRNRY